MASRINSENQKLLAKKAKAGDKEALNSLICGCHNELFRYCQSLTGDKSTGEDLCQECEIKVIRSIHLLEFPFKFLPWEKTIAKNLFLNYVSESKKHPMENLIEDNIPQANTELNLEDQLSFEEILTTLKEIDKNILILTLIYGYNYSEVAKILDIPSNLVGVKLFRLKKSFLFLNKT